MESLWVRPPITARGASQRPLAILFAGATAMAAAAVATLASPATARVCYPVLAATLVLFALYQALQTRSGAVPAVFEIGFIYALAGWLYACYPLVGFVVNGLEYGPFNDLRLHLAAPTPVEVARIGWMYVVHLVGFAAAYSWSRGAGVAAPPARMGRVEGVLLFLLVAAAQGYAYLLAWRFQWNFTSNLDRYVAFANLPQLTAQIAGHMDGIRLTAEIGLLVFLFQRYAANRIWILAWIAATAVQTFVQRQSRTELVLLCFASLILYNSFVRRLRVSHLAVLALAGLALFNLLGVRRMRADGIADLPPLRRLFVANEFETLFANAYDLDERVRSRTLEPPPPGIYATDLLALVPQQVLSWPKVTPADWYIRTMYPEAAEAGVGFCFGTVSESIVSFGWVDLLARGALLGLVLGLLRRTVEHRKGRSFWWFIFGVWLSVLIYNSFRNTTFAFAAMGWYRFLPVVLAVSAGSRLVRAALGRQAAKRA